MTVKKEAGDQEEEHDDDLEEETYTNQFVSNAIIKEEIMIECDADMEVSEIISDCITVQNSTPKNPQNQTLFKRRRKVSKNWKKDEVFTLDSEALQTVKNEGIWTKCTTNRTDKGNKVIFRCKKVKSRGQQCEAGLYLFYSNMEPTVTLFRSVNNHTCDSIKSRRKPYVSVKRKTKKKKESELNTKEVDENQLTLKRRKKTANNWKSEIVYESETDAHLAVKNEQTWTRHTTNKTYKGNKVIFRCRKVESRGQQCEAGIYLLYSHTDPTVTLFRSVNNHTCDSIESTRKPYVSVKSKTKMKTESELITKEVDENQSTKRRKKTLKNWQKEIVFESETDAQLAVKNEETWTRQTTNKTHKGNKVIFRCRKVIHRGQQCEAGVYLFYSRMDPTVTLFRSTNHHTCESIESTRKPYVRAKTKSKRKIEPEQSSTTTNDENQKNLNRRKKVVKNWQKEKTFELETEALQAVRSEKIWTKHTTNRTDKGNKVIYRCKSVKSKGQQCDAGVYLQYANTDATVTMFRSDNNHTCQMFESKRKSILSDDAKRIIKSEHEKGFKRKHVFGVLIANGFTSITQTQTNNYLAQLRREDTNNFKRLY